MTTSQNRNRSWSRRRFLRTGAAAGAGSMAVAAGVTAGTASADPPSGTNWTEVPSLGDEFEGTTLNREKWTTGHWNNTSGGVVAFKDENAEVSNGNLRLWTRKEFHEPTGMDYTVGIVRSVMGIPGNSYVEVKARMIPFAANVNSAIWLMKKSIPELRPNVEIDMQEYHLQNEFADRKNIHSGIHLWFVDPDDHQTPAKTEYLTTTNLDEGFHLYGLERREGRLRFFIDGGEPYWTYDAKADGHPEVATQVRPLILCCNGNAGTPAVDEAGESMDVEYVRVFLADG